MIKHEVRTCRSCGETVAVPVKRPNHILHLILSVLTGGIWVIVWLAAMVEAGAARPGRCPRCKGRV